MTLKQASEDTLPEQIDAYWSVESQKYSDPHERIRRVCEEVRATNSGGSVLDIGCGPGTVGVLLGDAVSYAGVDVFEQHLPNRRYGVFDLNEGNFDLFPFRETFDTVVISGVIEYLHIPRLRMLLRHISDHLSKDTTRFVFTYTNFSHYSRTRATYHPKWVNFQTPSQMERNFRDAGLTVVKKSPTYYFLLGRRFHTPFQHWIPFFSTRLGRQIVFTLEKKRK